MHISYRLLALLAVLALVVVACGEQGASPGETSPASVGAAPTDGPDETAPPDTTSYPREETLFTSGTQWGAPSNWNPIRTWDYAMGTVGLVYETLFLYEPLSDEFIPWLAESGEWTSENVYELTLREGIEWADGEPFTADDVVFTIELGQMASVPYSPVWDWLDSAEATDDHTVVFTFSDPRYQQWANWIYFHSIVPQHIWEGRSEEDVVNGTNENPIGTGPYEYLTHDQDRMVWQKRDGWWATEALGHDPQPTYIVDIVNPSNATALGLVLQGGVDLSNNFLPGIATLVEGGYGIETYFPSEPYMLAGNTAWLVLNTERPPLDDPAFRRALAFAVDVPGIVENVYQNIVTAANPTGLLPIWEQYVDQDVVDELGFSYDPDEARRLLADAGYEDSDGDGFVETPDGEPIQLSLIVPNGWSDWMEAINVIAASASAVGINVQTDFPEFPALVDQRAAGDFDMLINNERQVDNTPWLYYEYIFRLPIQDQQNTVNFGRYENEEAWQLTQELDNTPVDDPDAMREVISELQRIHLTDMPIIPLWYNGVWEQHNTSVWSGFPSSEGSNYIPATWRGYWQRGSILWLSELELTPQE
jgi:peptide/nickel transport system substrate-binding protein